MKKLSNFLKLNNLNAYALQLINLKKVWEDILPNIYKDKCVLYNFNKEKKIIYIKAFDNIIKDSLYYIEDMLLEKLAEKEFYFNEIKISYDISYDTIDIKPKKIEYKISQSCEQYIESKIDKIKNNDLKDSYRKMLTSFFKNNNYEEWILK